MILAKEARGKGAEGGVILGKVASLSRAYKERCGVWVCFGCLFFLPLEVVCLHVMLQLSCYLLA